VAKEELQRSKNASTRVETDIPLHVKDFLKLGLQPELSVRRKMDLQNIYLMLRLQVAAKRIISSKVKPSAS
jgi:hypothetical protein